MANIIDGKAVSAKVKEQVRLDTEALMQKYGIQPSLAVVIVGNDPASRVYVNNKKKACAAVGFKSLEYALPEETTQEELIKLVKELNDDPSVNGILVQLPVPKHINDMAIIKAISPKKDVDAFHPENVGRIMIGEYKFLPCTPAGVIELIDSAGIEIAGKNCVVIGRSNIVGKPMGMLLMHRNGTVTICHRSTRDLAAVCRQADILVSSVGKPNTVTGDMVKEGAVVIDVGINRLPDGSLCGDVNFAEVEPKASWITPVPGGVGPMTISMLMRNTLTAAKLQHGIKD